MEMFVLFFDKSLTMLYLYCGDSFIFFFFKTSIRFRSLQLSQNNEEFILSHGLIICTIKSLWDNIIHKEISESKALINIHFFKSPTSFRFVGIFRYNLLNRSMNYATDSLSLSFICAISLTSLVSMTQILNLAKKFICEIIPVGYRP